MGDLSRVWGKDPNENPQRYGIDKFPLILSQVPERNAD